MHFTINIDNWFIIIQLSGYIILPPEPTRHTKQTEVGAMKKAISLP